MKSSHLAWFWAIMVALVSLAMPAMAEQGKNQQCKEQQPAEVLCCRVVTKGDRHPPQWTTLDNMNAVWLAMFNGPSDVNLRNYKRQVRTAPHHKGCHAHKH